MIHLYAFVAGLRELPPDAELERLQLGAVTAVIGRLPDRPRSDSEADVVQHGLVVQALMERADAVLPARFGERFADARALEDAVRSRAVELERRLEHVRGCVEVMVRVSRTEQKARETAVDGGSYMRMRLREVTADEAVASELHHELRRRARSANVSQPLSGRLVHEAGYLVERDAVEDVAAVADAYADAHPHLTVVCTGPWAPSSFGDAA